MYDLSVDGQLPSSDRPAVRDDPAAPETLVEIFAATAAAHPNRVALDAPDATLTYAELADRAHGLAGRLRDREIGPGDRVAVRVPSGTAELYAAILGVLLAGAAYVPIDADDPPDRARQIEEGSGACATVVAGLRIVRHLRSIGGGEPVPPRPVDDAWIIFTSGSTGDPKGVAVTHRSAAAFISAEARLWTVAPEDRVLAGLSVGFDASCEEIWLAWAHGAALVPAPRALVRSGAELGPWLRERAVTVVSTVPTLAAIWDGSCLDGVRLLILGGEACPDALAWRLAAGREVWNTYGPTEATVVSTAARLLPGAPVTIGRPLHGWTAAVIGEDGAPVAPGEPGELVIGGVGLARYLDPALDAARFAPLPALGWERAYRSGDIVRERDGVLAFVGRRDDQVKVGGRRIELGEIDAALTSVDGVRTACTVVRATAAGNRILVGYVAGDLDAGAVRDTLATRLPAPLVPRVVVLPELPVAASGKVNKKALPWPPPGGAAGGSGAFADTTQRWLAERFADQLGPLPMNADSDFFALGGTSLAAAKLASTLRERVPTVAVADIYHHPRLGDLAARLDALGAVATQAPAPAAGDPRAGLARQLCGIVGLLTTSAPPWILSTLVAVRWFGLPGPRLGWGWLVGLWLVLCTPPARTALLALVHRRLIAPIAPGRHPRHGAIAARVWFAERLGESGAASLLAGTPWAPRAARLIGHRVGEGAQLGTLLPASGRVRIGAGATIEGDVDLRGWWIDGSQLVVDEIVIGARARIGTRALLMPGARIGAGAEIEPGAVVDGPVPAGERWAGAPARRVGMAGERWPAEPPPIPTSGERRRLKARYAAGLVALTLMPLLEAVPGLALLLALDHHTAIWPTARLLLELAPAEAVLFVATAALLTAALARAASRHVRPGRHDAASPTGWALWLTESAFSASRGPLFGLYASLLTRPWLRLAGIPVGRRTEICTAVGLNRLTRFGETAFSADDVVLAVARSRDGWLEVEGVSVGDRSFLGNGALLAPGTEVGHDSLIGLLTEAPVDGVAGSAWLGCPALELPRRPVDADPARTVAPSRSRVAGRLLVETVRVLLPVTLDAALGTLVFVAFALLGAEAGWPAMVLGAPLVLFGAGVASALLTAAVKWTAIGRYHAGDHPLWSGFVWRDEIVNSVQELLFGTWLAPVALGTPLMSLYLRLMGASVGRDVMVETLTITEFELARLDHGAVVNRNAVVETHLFHDRVMQMGPVRVGAGATLGPSAALLPDAALGEGCSVGGRAIVMRGETLPAHTRWHGAPVVAAG